MPTLHLVRGLPGSGKSTYISNRLDSLDYPFSVEWFEADMFFLTDKGYYRWSGAHLSAAHSWCYYNTLQALYSGKDCYVANTFTTLKEMQRYLDINIIISNVKIEIVEIHTQYESIHNVPKEVINKMKSRWYTFPENSFPIKVIK